MIATQPIPCGAKVVNMSWRNAYTCSVACTGKANVRLYHDSRRGVLQMIATQPIPRGAQVVNTYGDLPNSELLRRFGFVETEPNPHDCAQLQVQDLALAAARVYACDDNGGESAPHSSRNAQLVSGDSDTATTEEGGQAQAPLDAKKCREEACVGPGMGHAPGNGLADNSNEASSAVLSERQREGACVGPGMGLGRPGSLEGDCCLPAATGGDRLGRKRKSELEDKSAFGAKHGRTALRLGRDSNPRTLLRPPGSKGLVQATTPSPTHALSDAAKVGQSPADCGVSARMSFAAAYGIIEGGAADEGATAVAAERQSWDGNDDDERRRLMGRSFCIPCSGVPSSELLECARLLALSPTAFQHFRRSVKAWRCPLAKPLAQRRPADAPQRMRTILRGAVDDALGRYPAVCPLQSADAQLTGGVLRGSGGHVTHGGMPRDLTRGGSCGGFEALANDSHTVSMGPSLCEGREESELLREGDTAVSESASVLGRQQAAKIVVEGEVRCLRALRGWVEDVEPDTVLGICQGVWDRALRHPRAKQGP
jgi:hypothetical protein